MDFFAVPLLVIPGVALVILSTAARFGQLEAEIAMVLRGDIGCDARHRTILRLRVKRFRLALMCLYATIAALALSGLAGNLVPIAGTGAPLVLLCVAVLIFLAALTSLLLEARLSAEVALEQIAAAERGQAGDAP